MKFGNWILFFLTLAFSILVISEALSNDSEPKDEDISVEDIFEPQSEPFWTKGLRLSLGEKIATQPAICSLRSPTPSAYGALGEEIYVVWSDNRVGQRVLFMRRSRDGGLTWNEEERLTASKTDSVRPAIASDNKQVHLVWEERNEMNSEIFYKRWDGTGWSKEQVLSEGLSNSRRPDVAVTAGSSASMVYVVWESSVHNQLVAYLTRSEDGGVTWSAPRPIANITNASDIPAWNTSEPRVACGERTAYVVWRDERELEIPPSPFDKGGAYSSRQSRGQIFIKRWDEISIGNDIRLSAEGDYRRPDVSVSEPSVYVAWEGSPVRFAQRLLREPPGTAVSVSDIFVAQSLDGGQAFSPALQVTQSAAESTMPKIITLEEDNPLTPFGKGDDVWLFWQDGSLGNWEIYLAQKGSLNQNWGQPQQFTSTDIDSIMPVASPETRFLGENGFLTQIHLLWVARESEVKSHIMYSRRDTIPPLSPGKPAHLDVNSPKGYDNDDTLTFYWSHPSVNRLDGTESVHYIEHPAKYNVYFTTLEEEAQNAELKNKSEFRIPNSEFQLAGTTDKPSYSFKAESGKTYRVTVEAVDEVGNASELSEFSNPVFVDSHTPEVFIHLPKPNAPLVDSTPVIVTCLDDNLVEWRLQYKFTTKAALSWVDTESSSFAWKILASSNESTEYRRVAFWDVSGLEGVYTLELIAIDEAGNQSNADIPVIVDNNPPIPIISDGIGTELAISDLEADYHSPVWSPDGSMIAYASNEGGTYDIWIFDLKNGSKKRLTHDTAFDANPVWSPDSRWLAFQSFENDNWHICLIDVDGSERISIVEETTDQSDLAMYTTPAWSPNGEQLAFSSVRDGYGEIWLIKNVDEVLQGVNPNFIQLTQNDRPRKKNDRPRKVRWEDSSPTWSPDGTKIAFQSNRNGNWDIFRINVDGSQEEQLTDSVANEIKPKWSPDGKRILFISDNSEFRSQGEILALEIHNGAIISLSPIGVDVRHADWSPDLKSIVYQAGNTIYLTDFKFPSPQIEAVITRPHEGEYIGSGQSKDTSGFGKDGGMEGLPSNEVKGWEDGLVDIIGIARGTNFKEYRLEYALVDSASKLQIPNSEFRIPNSGGWITIGGVSTSQVPQVGFLGRLDTRGLQGEYILKLSVLGQNGEIAVDDVSVLVENEPPRLVVSEPPDGLITDNPLIVVSGETEANVQVTINDEVVKLQPNSQTARFDISLLLEEGDNLITVLARHTEFGLETAKSNARPRGLSVVQRRVFLDTQGITINVDDPKDFEVVNVPYVTVKGNVSQTAKIVKILETTVIGPEIQPQDEDLKSFQRTILLHEGVNLISIEAIDQLNRLTRIQRHVIYEKPAVIRIDKEPPGITNIIPPGGLAIANAKPEISAILVDDVQIDPETVTLTFDGKEIDKEKFDFNEKDGKFSYITEESFLDDGEHNFTIRVQDTSDNSARKSVQFFIDTEPLEIAISATKDNSRLKVILTSNKPLQSIPLATIIVRSSAIYCALTNGDESPYYKQSDCLGYSINLNQMVSDPENGKKTPFSFEGFFDATQLQNSFTFDAAVIDKFGEMHAVHGYYVRGSLSEGTVSSWGQMKIETDLHPSETTQKSEVNRIGISGIAEVIFPATILEPVHGIVLRSQDGLDLERLAAQRQNAADRGLELIDIVHVVEAKQPREEMTFILRLPIPKANNPLTPFDKGDDRLKEKFAFFYWDSRLQRWQAMDASRNFSEGWIQAQVNEFGPYALLADETLPTIANLRPKDHQEVPLDRFLVEAEVYDDGSGIDKDRIELLIDDKPAEFTYEPAHNRITYLPSNLKEGLHTLKLSVQDRASNIQTISSTFFTSEIFDFAEEVIAYPNPAKNADIVTIRFKLTKTADVTLKIYNVAGEIIYTEQKSNAIGRSNDWFVWNCQNQAKLPVASGVYIYILEAENSTGQKVRRSGKIAVVK